MHTISTVIGVRAQSVVITTICMHDCKSNSKKKVTKIVKIYTYVTNII